MNLRFLISSIIVLASFTGMTQTALPSKVFHKHIQTCHYVGTTEEDYTVELWVDSTIRITRYSSNFRDQYNSTLRLTYEGKWSLSGDTLTVTYTNSNSKRNNKGQSPKIISQAKITSLDLPYPPTSFVLQNNSISPSNGAFPTLEPSTLAMVLILESKFANLTKPDAKKKTFELLNR